MNENIFSAEKFNGGELEDQDNKEEGDLCRICFLSEGRLISTCRCAGTLKYVHEDCIKAWLGSLTEKGQAGGDSELRESQCELCQQSIRFRI